MTTNSKNNPRGEPTPGENSLCLKLISTSGNSKNSSGMSHQEPPGATESHGEPRTGSDQEIKAESETAGSAGVTEFCVQLGLAETACDLSRPCVTLDVFSTCHKK
ncbi:hypothetical protein ElyMa_004157500 [Elysia marginata]|uniref:Uncharacterized protein n=1 Tax=Elysia marginata TaxID=1093978 RepID=A0AAV4GJ90_9GAST|nr:hypothetical protein ElyMa_004157500 [Elysia marginata]